MTEVSPSDVMDSTLVRIRAKRDRELGAAGFAGDRHVSRVRVDDGGHDRQTDPGVAGGM
jgi:hypothetical protein